MLESAEDSKTVIEAIGAAGDGVMLYASMEGNRVQGGSPQLAQTIAAIQQGGGAPDGIHI
jgi:hypothetical protein